MPQRHHAQLSECSPDKLQPTRARLSEGPCPRGGWGEARRAPASQGVARAREQVHGLPTQPHCLMQLLGGPWGPLSLNDSSGKAGQAPAGPKHPLNPCRAQAPPQPPPPLHFL